MHNGAHVLFSVRAQVYFEHGLQVVAVPQGSGAVKTQPEHLVKFLNDVHEDQWYRNKSVARGALFLYVSLYETLKLNPRIYIKNYNVVQ